MKESTRRLVLFTVIVATGSIMILFDIPLIAMIPLIAGVGFVILMALGAVTVSDIREISGKARLRDIRKFLHLARPETKPQQGKTSPQPDKKKSSTADSKTPVKPHDKKTGVLGHLTSFVSSVRSLGTVIRERSKQGKKVEDINRLLDKTISEKVSRSALASAGNIGTPSLPSPGGAGSLDQKEQDPFLSLSGDEFDAGLLDELDDQDMLSSGETGSPSGSPDSPKMLDESDSTLPAPDFSSETDNILKENASEGLGEFDGLDGSDTIDQDFEDLENISLDDVDLGDETGEELPEEIAEPSEPEAAPQPQPAAAAGPVEVKNDWITSDTPQEDDFSSQADMAEFAGGHGSDDDLLSSIAADVKHVKKESDLSLLRELKDFKAPADEIAEELTAMYERISSAPKKEQKILTPQER